MKKIKKITECINFFSETIVFTDVLVISVF